MGGKTPQNALKPPFPLQHVNPHLIHQCLGQPSNTPNDSSIGTCTSHNYATKSPLVTRDAPNSTPNLPLPLRRSPPHLMYPCLDQPHSPSQMASGSMQPFCHSTLSRLTDTDRPTDGLGYRSVRILHMLAILTESDALKMWQTNIHQLKTHNVGDTKATVTQRQHSNAVSKSTALT